VKDVCWDTTSGPLWTSFTTTVARISQVATWVLGVTKIVFCQKSPGRIVGGRWELRARSPKVCAATDMRWAVLYTLLFAWVSGTLGAAAGPHALASPWTEAPAPIIGRPPGAAGERAAAALQLRGGGKKKETDKAAVVGKGKGKAAGGGDEDEEIGGLRPEPYEEPEGGRVDFHNVKLKQLADIKSGVLQPSAGLKALKRDRNIFLKVCAAQTGLCWHALCDCSCAQARLQACGYSLSALALLAPHKMRSSPSFLSAPAAAG